VTAPPARSPAWRATANDRYGDRPEYARRLLAAELGVRLARAAAEFWDEIAEREEGQLADGEARSAA
jgi:hypothetical protein